MKNIKADAVIFDKDGTLIDFDAFWVSLSDTALNDLLGRLNQDKSLTGEILEAFGVHNGVTNPNGVLCKGTYAQMAQIVHDILAEHSCLIPVEEIEPAMLDAYNTNLHAGRVKPTCANLAQVLTTLKGRNKKLAVVTTDNRKITLFCLEQLGIADFFDKIYTDDGRMPTKPDPACALDFCASTALAKDAVVMVGDTMTDISFAYNAGIKAIGIAKNAENEAIFCGKAHAIIRDISELLEILE